MNHTQLTGRRLLVVEDEYFVAQDVCNALEDAGASVLGPVPSVEDAIELIGAEADIDGAVLDMNLGGEPATRVGEALTARGIPFVFTTGYERSSMPEGHGAVAVLDKPFDSEVLLRVLSEQVFS